MGPVRPSSKARSYEIKIDLLGPVRSTYIAREYEAKLDGFGAVRLSCRAGACKVNSSTKVT